MYNILEIRDNTTVNWKHPSFGTFDVNTQLTNTDIEKWLSIPHELFFEYLKFCNPSLHSYVDKQNFDNWEMAICDMISIGYDFEEDITKYISVHYNPFTFKILPSYDPDFVFDDMDYL